MRSDGPDAGHQDVLPPSGYLINHPVAVMVKTSSPIVRSLLGPSSRCRNSCCADFAEIDSPAVHALRLRRGMPASARTSSSGTADSVDLRLETMISASSSVIKSGSLSERRSAGVSSASISSIAFSCRLTLVFAGIDITPATLRTATAADVADPGKSGPTLVTALEKQLGLKLTKVKDIPVDMLIVDRVDKTPTDN